MSKQIKVLVGHILTIRRPNGTVEQTTAKVWGDTVIPASRFAAIVKATREAGRGDVLSQEPAYKMMDEPQPSASDLADAKYRAERASIERTSATGRA